MGGQWRACTVGSVLSLALLCAAVLSGCSSPAGAPPEELCDLPATGSLARPEEGGFEFTYGNGARARIAFANGSCVLDSNPFPIQREERSEWELGFTYDYYIAELGPCLNGFGFPTLAPPKRDAFIALGGDWSPYDAVFTSLVSGSDIAELSRVCPGRPPALR